MATFKTVLRGYDKKEVERYLRSVELKRGATDDTYQERIASLNEEIKLLSEKIRAYEEEKDLLSSGVIKLAKLEEESKRRIKEREELERERLEIFGEKWKLYARDVIQDEGSEVTRIINDYLRDYTIRIKDGLKNIGISHGREDKSTTSNDEKKLRDLCISLGILEE